MGLYSSLVRNNVAGCSKCKETDAAFCLFIEDQRFGVELIENIVAWFAIRTDKRNPQGAE
jgi:hypothetical protein